MAAYRRVYDSRHLQADCQEPGSAPEPYTLGSRVWATVNQHLPCVDTLRVATSKISESLFRQFKKA